MIKYSKILHKEFNKITSALFFLSVFLMFYKGIQTPFTFDEAQTYLEYVLHKDFIKFAIANNHPFNTLLMIVFSYIGSSPFILRLPNLIFGLVYLSFSYNLSKKTRNPIISYLIFGFSPYAFEFLTLARGYGLAYVLIFLGIAYYYYFDWNKYSIIVSSIFFILANISIFPTAVFTFSFFLISMFQELKNKNYINYFGSGIICGAVAYKVTAFMFVITETYASGISYLYGLKNYNLEYFIKTIFGFGPLFNPYNDLYGGITLIVLLFIVFNHFLFSKDLGVEKNILYIFLLTTAIIYIVPILLEVKLPEHRILIPFLPPLLFVVVASINGFFNRKKNRLRQLLQFLLPLILSFNFLMAYRFDDTFDWDINRVDPGEPAEYLIDQDTNKCFYPHTENPANEYYIEEAKKNNLIYCDDETGVVFNK
tara:strand:+ start:5567 stop:6838 length:1272 start_codon:yes stop_codon:yes gene_type:complete